MHMINLITPFWSWSALNFVDPDTEKAWLHFYFQTIEYVKCVLHVLSVLNNKTN